LRIINGIKYKNVFKLSNRDGFFSCICFFCNKKITKKHYSGFIIPSNTDGGLFCACTDCCRSPIHVEKTIIPLLKIKYGGIVKVSREYYDYNKESSKLFYY
jgi:hypothetical protein